jgi:hypothetical protein
MEELGEELPTHGFGLLTTYLCPKKRRNGTNSRIRYYQDRHICKIENKK